MYCSESDLIYSKCSELTFVYWRLYNITCFLAELRLAQLALDPSNSPAWEVPEQERRPSTKMPLFVRAQPVYKSQHQTEVRDFCRLNAEVCMLSLFFCSIKCTLCYGNLSIWKFGINSNFKTKFDTDFVKTIICWKLRFHIHTCH
jgi:hypothetical protein